MVRRSINVAGLEHGAMPIPVASRIGPFIATGGVRGVDRATGIMAPDLESQVKAMFANVRAIMEAAGSDCDAILKLSISIESDAARPLIDREWVEMFPDNNARPARAVQVGGVSHGKLVQCDVLAVAQGE